MSVLSCRITPILCMNCGLHRHMYELGYGRPFACKCYFCQHNPLRPIPYCPVLETEYLHG